LVDIIKLMKARSVAFLVRGRLYIHLNKKTVNGLLGIGNIEKVVFENTSFSESSKTEFKDSTNKVFDLTL